MIQVRTPYSKINFLVPDPKETKSQKRCDQTKSPKKKEVTKLPLIPHVFIWPAKSLNGGPINRKVTENSACYMQKATDCPEAIPRFGEL